MTVSYTKNYLKIYFWQGISLVLNFLSMLIVIPYLTSEPEIYGIYSICISITIFLSYADLGFIGAGRKYASEYFAKGDRKEEISIIGFTNFILLVFLLLFSLVFLTLSSHPGWLIKDIKPGRNETIASSLLLIVALFTPVTLLQRILQMIFGIRLEDFILQRVNVFASSLKILSVLWFFRNSQYNIVGYFLFVQTINLGAATIALFIAKKRYNYDFIALLKSIHFNRNVFAKTKTLAFTSLYLTITWILYYELDPTAIGKLLGAKQVAIFAIGLTIMSFFRNVVGILFSPFNSRFNHFIGKNDEAGLKSFFTAVTTTVAPLIIIPTVTISIFAKPLILSWVGPQYVNSIQIAQFLILCNVYAFITYPTSLLLMAMERIKEMYWVNTLIPFVYWIGIALTYTIIGLNAFALFKFLAFSISAIVYFFILKKYLNLSITQSFQRYILPVTIPLIYIFVTASFATGFLPMEKSKLNLLIVTSFAVIIIVSSFALVYLFSRDFKSQSKKIFSQIKIS